MSVEKAVFGTLPDGREVPVYTLKNAGGMTLVTTPYGCRIVQLWVPDRNGTLGDVVLGHRTLEEYFGSNYQGALWAAMPTESVALRLPYRARLISFRK